MEVFWNINKSINKLVQRILIYFSVIKLLPITGFYRGHLRINEYFLKYDFKLDIDIFRAIRFFVQIHF